MKYQDLRKIEPQDIKQNPFTLIDDDWFLLSAGSLHAFNTMTASWGGVGILWNKPVVFCFVRPQRYTYKFMESNEFFTMSFFDESNRDALSLCGKVSGRQTDKMKATGLIPFESPQGSVFFEQSKLMIECRKLYFSDIIPEHFQVEAINKNYPKKDYHRMYIGEITSCFTNFK
ncbi:MAG: flavin reductase family protein [Lentimicrobium sp.]|nr:flavin reductase family protein [Lentimicrobium sp.]